MPIRYKITRTQVQELEEARRKNKNKNVERRLRALLLHSEGMKCKDVANKTGYSYHYVSKLVARYCNNGIENIIENNYKGNNRNLSLEEEKELLSPFVEKAESGQLIDVNEIKLAYEQAVGKSLKNSHGQIYFVLERHGFRKIMPRSKHPNKASEEVIETSKKLTI